MNTTSKPTCSWAGKAGRVRRPLRATTLAASILMVTVSVGCTELSAKQTASDAESSANAKDSTVNASADEIIRALKHLIFPQFYLNFTP